MEGLWELCEDSVSPQRRFRAAPSRPLKNQTRAMARENRLGIPLAANVLQRGPKGGAKPTACKFACEPSPPPRLFFAGVSGLVNDRLVVCGHRLPLDKPSGTGLTAKL